MSTTTTSGDVLVSRIDRHQSGHLPATIEALDNGRTTGRSDVRRLSRRYEWLIANIDRADHLNLVVPLHGTVVKISAVSRRTKVTEQRSKLIIIGVGQSVTVNTEVAIQRLRRRWASTVYKTTKLAGRSVMAAV